MVGYVLLGQDLHRSEYWLGSLIILS
jgi:hypothetical protein